MNLSFPCAIPQSAGEVTAGCPWLHLPPPSLKEVPWSSASISSTSAFGKHCMLMTLQPYCQARHPAQKGAKTSRSHCAHKHCWNCHQLSSCSLLQFNLMIETVLDSSPSVPLKSWLTGMSKVTILSWTLARLPATKFSGFSPGFNETESIVLLRLFGGVGGILLWR